MYHQSQGTSTCSLKSTHWHPMAGFRPAGLNALRTCPQLTSSIGSKLDTFAPAKGFSDCFGNPSSHWASNSGIRQANPPIHRRICKDFLRRLTISPIWMIHTCWTQTAHGCLISGCHRWACCLCLCKALCMRPMSASFDVQNTLRNYPQGCRLLSNVQVLEGSRGREGGRKGGRLHVVLQATDCLKIKLSSNQTKLYFSLYCVCIIYNYIYVIHIYTYWILLDHQSDLNTKRHTKSLRGMLPLHYPPAQSPRAWSEGKNVQSPVSSHGFLRRRNGSNSSGLPLL